MLFRKSVVLSVLAAFAVASHSVFADVALSPRGGENRRQLKKRGKKSRTIAAPTQPAFTRSTMELRLYAPVVGTAGGYQIFTADDVNKENALNDLSYTVRFEYTAGETFIEQSTYFIEQSTCDVTLCLTVPHFGGCVFLRGIVNTSSPAFQNLYHDTPITLASTGGTGIFFFGQEAFASFSPNNSVEIIEPLFDGDALINEDVIYKFDITIIESAEQTENNKLYAEEVPGFVPAEGLGEFYGEEYSSLYDYIESLKKSS